MLGTRVRSLVQEDPTCRGAIQPVSPPALTTEPVFLSREATAMRSLCTAAREETPLAATKESLLTAMKTQSSQK